ncbi:OmpL47-type beta-barrel domain-containing protein [Paenibacillus ginsengarvi]|uniref:OmpL47-type beta-barrel domain-containing protein n=1 Tax=Paenibacillus ginsengarvi TaxID=400777 RepID=UPI000EA8B6BB|nr:immunoglobulin-like domain-containing protein [Paenibacillus ginsengarvi]
MILAIISVLVMAGLGGERLAMAAEGYPPHPLPSYIATQQDYTLGLKPDGTVVGDGQVQMLNLWDWTNVKSIDAGLKHAVAVTTDGRVYAAGKDGGNACFSSDDLTQKATQWTQMKSVVAGDCFTVGLKTDGTVVGLGKMNGYGQISNLSEWSGITQIAAGDNFTVGLTSGGKVVMKGNNFYGQDNVGSWSNIVQIAAGDMFILGLRADGTVVSTGSVDVSGWKDIVWISAGSSVAAAVTKEGKVVTAGYVFSDIETEMKKWTDIIQVSIRRQSHAVAVRKNGQAVAAVQVSGFNYKPQVKWSLKQYTPQRPASIAAPSSPRTNGLATLQWTSPGNWGLGSDRYYQVEFYDGSAWSTIGERVTDATFSYDIPDAVHTTEAKFRVRAGTEYGLSDYTTTDAMVIDSIPPQAPLIALSTEAWSDQPVTVTIADGQALSGVDRTEYRLNGGLWQTYTAPLLVETEGETKVEARAWNTLGGVSEASAKTARIDRLAPESPVLTADASGWTHAEEVTVSVTDGADAGIGVLRSEVRIAALDGAVVSDWTPYVPPLKLQDEGRWTVHARTVDKLGHVSGESAFDIWIDRTKPNAPVVTTQTSDWIDAPAVTVAVYGDDGLSGLQRLEYKLSGGASADWTAYTGELRIEAEGETEVRVRAIDKAGNVSDESSAWVRIDRSAPETPVVSASESDWTARDVKVNLAGTDRLSGLLRFQVKQGAGGAWQDVAPGDFATVTAEAETTVTARAVDRLGHISAEASVLVRIDRTKPNPPLVTPQTSDWIDVPAVTVAVYGDDGLSGLQRLEYKLSGGTSADWTEYTGELRIEAEGETEVRVRAIDKAGNVSDESSAWVRIDRSAPETPVVSASESGWTARDVKVNLAGTDRLSGLLKFQVKLGAVTWQDVAPGDFVTVTAEGETTVTARAVDRLDHISAEATLLVRVDRTTPSVPIIATDAAGWTSGNVTVSVYGSADAVSGVLKYQFKLGTNGTWSDVSGAGITVSAEGETPIYARALDVAGNVSEAAYTVVRIDRTAPSAPALTPSTTYWTNDKITFTMSGGADAGSGITRWQYRISPSGSWTDYEGAAVTVDTEGETTVFARVMDHVGLVSGEASAVLHIDRTPPSVPVLSLSEHGWSNRPVTFEVYGSTDMASGVAKYMVKQGVNAAWTEYPGTAVEISSEGETPVFALAVDGAGNRSAEARAVVRIDQGMPVLTLKGDNPLLLEVGTPYAEPGAEAADAQDGDLTGQITVTGSVYSAKLGAYELRYRVSDRTGNTVEAIRIVQVVDTTKPAITIMGANPVIVALGDSYTDTGATATDNYDGDITSRITVTGSVYTKQTGIYAIRYSVSDSSGNAAEAVRFVQVVDKVSPYIVLIGENPLEWPVGTVYVDPGARAFDPQDGDLTGRITVTGLVDASRLGSYVLRYEVTDQAGNPAIPVTRSVRVTDTIRPIITLRGEPEMSIGYGVSFIDPGAVAKDNYDGDISGSIRVSGYVDSRKPGVYELRYQAEDSSGNRALEVVRKVKVLPLALPEKEEQAEEGGGPTPSSPISTAPEPNISGPGPATGKPEAASPGILEVSGSANDPDMRLTVRGEAFAAALAETRGEDVILSFADIMQAAGGRSVRVDLSAESVAAAAQAGKKILLLGAEAGYLLDPAALELSSLAERLGSNLEGMTISVTMRAISEPDRLQGLKRQMSEAGYRLLAPAMDFGVSVTAGKTVMSLDSSPQYVPKTIKLRETANPDETTVVRILPDGSISFVPAVFSGDQVTVWSRTNGTYVPVVRESGTFTDITGHWAEKEIDRLKAKLIVQGMPDGSFHPDEEISRAQFAVLLARMLELRPVPPQGRFKDVAEDDWYAGTIAAAQEAGLVGGFDDGTFRPDAPVTREQMAVMLARAMTFAGFATDGDAGKSDELLEGFRDREAISSWARDGVARNAKAGVITGFTDTSYAPNRNASRAEAAVMISRWLTFSGWMN